MYIRVNLTPKAKKEKVERVNATTFNISVKEPAQRNQANRRLCQLVGNELGFLPREVKIISGHHSRKKLISIPDEE